MQDKRLNTTKWGRAGSFESYDEVRTFFDSWAKKPNTGAENSISYEVDLTDCYHAPAITSQLLLSALTGGPKRIIDLGCGTGLAGLPLIHEGHRLYGLDLSSEMLDLASSKGYEEVFAGNILSVELPWREPFDAMISVGVIGEWIPAIPLLRRSLKYMADDSIIAMTLEVEHSDIDPVAKYLESEGYRVLHIVEKLGVEHPLYDEEFYFFLLASRGVNSDRKAND
jgi:predicted TPR repeat methyltransferase